jgi:hypothetical protein
VRLLGLASGPALAVRPAKALEGLFVPKPTREVAYYYPYSV